MLQNPSNQPEERTPEQENKKPILNLEHLASELKKASRKNIGIENENNETWIPPKKHKLSKALSVDAQEENLRKHIVRKPKTIEKTKTSGHIKSIKSKPFSIQKELHIDKNTELEPLDYEQDEISTRAKKIATNTMEKVITDAYLERNPEIKSFEEIVDENIEQEVNKKEILPNTNEKLTFREMIEDAEDLDELIGIIKNSEGIMTTNKYYSTFTLVGRINLLQSKELTLDYIPSAEGLRSKVAELLKKEVPTESQHIKIEKVEEIPLGPSIETKKIEENLRKEVQEIFHERIDEIFSKVSTNRVAYGKQIKIKTQHEQAQTRIGTIKSKLFSPFTRKPSLNNEEYDKSRMTYMLSIDELKKSLHDEVLEEKVLKKAFELGDRGLEIANEEKEKIKQLLISKILLEEKTLVVTMKIESLPKRDADTANRLVTIRRNRRRDDDDHNLEYMKDIINPDEYEYAK